MQNASTHTRANAENAADPDDAYLANLRERAFNLNPTQPGRPTLLADTGTSGLPLIRRTGEPQVFSIQYLRRKASANFGAHLHAAVWLQYG